MLVYHSLAIYERGAEMKHITFTTCAVQVSDAEAIYMLGRSIRDFGCGLSEAGLHSYIPEFCIEDWLPLCHELSGAGISLQIYKVK